MREIRGQYALAFVETGDAQAFSEFRRFADLVSKIPELAAFLSRMDVPMQARVDFALSTLSGSSERVNRFVGMLVERGLASAVPSIQGKIEAIQDERAGKARVKLQSAQPIGEDERERLKAWLGNKLGKKEVALDLEIEPKLLAGIRAESGSLVLDASYRGQLRRLEKMLVE
jgi:ATP synthase F1 delta subunit